MVFFRCHWQRDRDDGIHDPKHENTGSAGRHILGYFTGAGNPVMLAQGESLTLNFTVSFPRGYALGAGNDFRVGIWDSQGQRVSPDNHGGTGTPTAISAFSNYAGYVFAGGVDASRTISIRKRETGTAGILISGTSVISRLIQLDFFSGATWLTALPSASWSWSWFRSLRQRPPLWAWRASLRCCIAAAIAASSR